MPWQRVWFKKNKAYVRVDEQGKLIERDGRVEICYKPDDTRVYQAARSNIRYLDEGPPPQRATAPAESPPKKASPSGPAPEKPPLRPGRPIDIWTDGACSGNPGAAGAGIVMIYGRHRREVSRYLGTATNNIAELQAIRIALELVRDTRRPVRVHTDSTYAMSVLVSGWKAKKNTALVAEIREMLKGFARVEFVKVAAHAGVAENEMADELARLAVSTRRDSETRRES